MSQETLKTMPMQIFFGGRGGVGKRGKEVYYGICASRELVGFVLLLNMIFNLIILQV